MIVSQMDTSAVSGRSQLLDRIRNVATPLLDGAAAVLPQKHRSPGRYEFEASVAEHLPTPSGQLVACPACLLQRNRQAIGATQPLFERCHEATQPATATPSGRVIGCVTGKVPVDAKSNRPPSASRWFGAGKADPWEW